MVKYDEGLLGTVRAPRQGGYVHKRPRAGWEMAARISANHCVLSVRRHDGMTPKP